MKVAMASLKTIVFAVEVALDNVSGPAIRVPNDSQVGGNNWTLLMIISGFRLVMIYSH